VARNRRRFRHVGRRDECRGAVDGYAKGGAAGARTALENFWRRVSEAARFNPFRRGPLDVLLGRWTLDSSPMYVAMDLMSRLLSPYDLNPMGKNPLRAILAETIDFGRLARAPIKLFITATNVRTGRGHVFRNDAVTPDVLLASACLPTMFQAIEIDGEPHWDGGYSGNTTGSGTYDALEAETRGPFKGPRAYDATGLPLHFDNQSTFKEKFFIDSAGLLHDQITTFDHALTQPWSVDKTFKRNPNPYPNWSRVACTETTQQIVVGKEPYMMSADGFLMPAKKDQAPPDLRYFKQTQK
jgi:hypothetical protein